MVEIETEFRRATRFGEAINTNVNVPTEPTEQGADNALKVTTDAPCRRIKNQVNKISPPMWAGHSENRVTIESRLNVTVGVAARTTLQEGPQTTV